MTKNRKSSAADEMLRQSVFSSIHLSSRLKSDVVKLSTPLCSNCGANKTTCKKKPGSYHLSIYTNNSEPFVVWFKKREEPKGILWLRNYVVRKSSGDANELELVSTGCPFKCSYRIILSNSKRTSEWYQLLKDESRRQPSIDDISSESILDSYSDDYSQRSFYNEDDNKLELADSDSETCSLSSSVDSEDKLSLSNDYSVGSPSPVQPNCAPMLLYFKGSKSRNQTTSALPHLRVKETKKVKSTSLLLSPKKSPLASPQMLRKPLSYCDYNSESDLAERWSWPTTHKQ